MAQLDIARTTEYALRLDVATAKRLGWVLESKGVNPSEVDRLTGASDQGLSEARFCWTEKGPLQ